MKKPILLFGLLLAVAQVVSAKVVLPTILSDGMVLQQRTDVKLWGKAAAGKKVKVTPSWDGKTYSALADEAGKWLLTVPTPAAGGPYEIEINDGEPLVLRDVLVGEVWLCSGQSNMEMPMGGFYAQPVEGANDLIAHAKPATPIRMYTAKIMGSPKPLGDVPGVWQQHASGNLPTWSATAYFFGKYLQEVLDVPVGLVVSAWGGSKVEAWMSPEALKDFPEYDLSYLATGTEPTTRKNHTPCYIYNAMIYPLVNFAIKGCIWYQGEANIDNYETYARLMPAFVQDWRDKWGIDFPFYYTQIAPFAYQGADSIESARLREVQLRNMADIPLSGMAVTLDAGEERCIHPARKQLVGSRLAYWALAKTYGLKGIGYCAPQYDSMEVRDGKVYVKFKSTSNSRAVTPIGRELKCMEVAGADRVFYPAKAWIDPNKKVLVAYSEQVPAPVAVRYGYRNYVQGDLYDEFGIPLSPFRSDDW